MKRWLSLFVVAIALLACLSTLLPQRRSRAEVLEAGPELRWHRGNMHTHSHWSDGDDYLEMIAVWYQEQGYQFLVFTDHNVLATAQRWEEIDKTKGGRTAYEKLKARFPDWVDERVNDGKEEIRLRTFAEVADRLNVPGEYLLIQGEEISDRFERYPIHLNVSNVVELIQPRGGASVFETIQNNVDAVIAQRERTGQPMIVHLNHPNFGFAVTAEDLMRVQGEKFFEVYNGHPTVYNQGNEIHAGTERIWDIVLTQRLAALNLPVMYGLAVDDGHNYHIPADRPPDAPRRAEPGRGWVYVLAPALTPEALIEALEAGRFYSSTGVTLARVASSSEGLLVEVEPKAGETYRIDFIGTRAGADLTGTPVLDDKGNERRATYRYSPEIGEVIRSVEGTRAEYRFEGNEYYIRARITSSAKHPNPSEEGEFQQAWAQPVVGPATPTRKASGR